MRTMGRHRRGGRRGGRHSFKIPVLTIAILAGQVLTANAASSIPAEKINRFQQFYTGFDLTGPDIGRFHPDQLAIGYGPWIIKGLIRKVARPLGALPKIPFGLPFSVS